MNEKQVWMLSSQTATNARARFSRSQTVGSNRSGRDRQGDGVGEISKEETDRCLGSSPESPRSLGCVEDGYTHKKDREGIARREAAEDCASEAKREGRLEKDQVVAGVESRPEAWDVSIDGP